MKNKEDDLQTAVVTYLKLEYKALFCASLGGAYQKHHSQRLKAKRTGYIAGFPDLFIYEPRGVYHGLALELKTLKGTPYKGNGHYKKLYDVGGKRYNQTEWLEGLRLRGYHALFVVGFDNTKNVIDKYFSLNEGESFS